MNVIYVFSAFGLALTLVHAEQKSVPQVPVKKAYEKVQHKTGAQQITEVTFTKGSSDLSQDAMETLRNFLYEAEKGGHKVAEVTVAAWADKEYPTSGADKLDPDQRRLASDRLASIKNYFGDKVGENSVKTINMAEQPDALEKLIKTSKDAKVKEALVQSGVARPYQTGLPPEASHAIVLLNFK